MHRATTAVRIIGPGRAGTALAQALGACGWQVSPTLGRADDLSGAAAGVDLLFLATPDAAIRGVQRSAFVSFGSGWCHNAIHDLPGYRTALTLSRDIPGG